MASRLEKAGVDTRTNTGIGSDLKGCIKLRLSVMCIHLKSVRVCVGVCVDRLDRTTYKTSLTFDIVDLR